MHVVPALDLGDQQLVERGPDVTLRVAVDRRRRTLRRPTVRADRADQRRLLVLEWLERGVQRRERRLGSLLPAVRVPPCGQLQRRQAVLDQALHGIREGHRGVQDMHGLSELARPLGDELRRLVGHLHERVGQRALERLFGVALEELARVEGLRRPDEHDRAAVTARQTGERHERGSDRKLVEPEHEASAGGGARVLLSSHRARSLPSAPRSA